VPIEAKDAEGGKSYGRIHPSGQVRGTWLVEGRRVGRHLVPCSPWLVKISVGSVWCRYLINLW